MNTKKMAAIVTIFVLISNIIPKIYAYDYPSSFWSANSKYDAALNSNNHFDIIRYGEQIINLMASAADGKEKQDIMVTRYKQVGLAYAAISDYDNAARIFSDLYNYSSKYEQHWEYAKTAKSRLNQYTSAIAMYTDNGTSTYYGAKNEKKNGVLFGACCDGGIRSKLANESMTLVYHELGKELGSYNEGEFRKAASNGKAIEYALNCPKEGTDIRNIKNLTSSLKSVSDLLAKYPDTPIYLRFAAEFDIWDNETDAESFKEAYRYVSSYFKERNSNVAMVWSPNQTAKWYIDIDDYYPGDEYVDWVGMSLYASKYFMGDKNQSEDNEIIFKAGINADPVIAVKDIIEKYGGRKPIMLSEYGCGHTLVKSGEDTSAFGIQKLKEYLNYLPMVYPQIKLVAYFDQYIKGEDEQNDYRLTKNTQMQSEFLKLTSGSRFIQDKFNNETSFCYRKIGNGTSVGSVFPVSCYAHIYNTDIKSVTYHIDGKYAGMSSEIPYTAYIDASGYSGTHTLKTTAAFTNGKTLTTESEIKINTSNNDVKVKISGNTVFFDQNPIIYNDRTMVPMRKIFEELGAAVTWDGNTRTASGKRGDRTVKITVGSNKMYVNSKSITLDTAPIILSERTLVPVRAVAEGLGCDVDWIGDTSTVTIEPKIFRWSDWTEQLPYGVDDDLYYIEQKQQSRQRTREKKFFTKTTLPRFANDKLPDNYVRTDISYGSWSDWQDEYISENEDREVETRTQSKPYKYFYAHYCTGDTGDASTRYHVGNYEFSDACSYHILGWFDYKLPLLGKDDFTYIQNDSNGNRVSCPNNIGEWYILNTEGGNYTQYRSRPIYKEYVFWEWSDWSEWSEWRDNTYAYGLGDNIDFEERELYRYKEK